MLQETADPLDASEISMIVKPEPDIYEGGETTKYEESTEGDDTKDWFFELMDPEDKTDETG
jgi:hypothetical protein